MNWKQTYKEIGVEDDSIPELLEGQSVLFAMGKKEGHEAVVFDPRDPASVERARKLFTELRAKGFAIHRVQKGKPGEGEVITDFPAEMGSFNIAVGATTSDTTGAGATAPAKAPESRAYVGSPAVAGG